MKKHHIYARLTHKYRAGWSHLDRHEYVFDLKLTTPRILRRDDDGGFDHILHGRLSAKQRAQAKAVWEKLPRRDRPPFKHWLRDVIAGAFDSGFLADRQAQFKIIADREHDYWSAVPNC